MARPPAGRRPVRLGAAAVLGALAVLTAACGTAAPPASAPAGPALPVLPPPPPVAWSPCPAGSTLQCGSVSVPLDYRHPAAGTLEIAVTRAPALDPTAPGGTLVFNPGGPAESGNQILPLVLPLLPPAVRRRDDVVSFDPRGTGASEALRCGTDPSTVTSVDPVPTTAGAPLPGTPVFAAQARACAALHPRLTPHVDTADTARDMDRIRQALGVSRISYYGLSYGTVLGAEYAQLFPTHVRALVLDGAVDVNASLLDQAAEEAPAAEASLHHLLDGCAAQPACPLGPDPTAAYRSLEASLATRPLPAPGHGDTVPVTVGDLDTAALLAVSVTDATGSFETAVAAARRGDGASLRALALTFDTDLDGAPLVDPLWAITCHDAPDHPSPVAAGAEARTLAARYPLLGGYTVTYTLGGCVAWPTGADPVTDIHPTGTPPVLVIGNTGDPNTPHVAAVHLAAAFPRASLLTWDGWGHTWLLSGSRDACMQAAVGRYLTTGTLPAPGTVCH